MHFLESCRLSINVCSDIYMIMNKIYDPEINEMKNVHKFQLLFKLQILFQAYFKYHEMPQPRILQLPWIRSSR